MGRCKKTGRIDSLGHSIKSLKVDSDLSLKNEGNDNKDQKKFGSGKLWSLNAGFNGSENGFAFDFNLKINEFVPSDANKEESEKRIEKLKILLAEQACQIRTLLFQNLRDFNELD